MRPSLAAEDGRDEPVSPPAGVDARQHDSFRCAFAQQS